MAKMTTTKNRLNTNGILNCPHSTVAVNANEHAENTVTAAPIRMARHGARFLQTGTTASMQKMVKSSRLACPKNVKGLKTATGSDIVSPNTVAGTISVISR